jgi:hypothetical protein
MHRREAQQQDVTLGADEGQNIAQVLPFSDDRMEIQFQERRRAREIRAAVREDPKLQPMSDFMYAHFAIVSLMEETDVAVVLSKIRQVQHLKRENGIFDNYVHGKQAVSQMLTGMVARMHLAFGYDSVEQAYFHVTDITKFDPDLLSDPAKTRAWLTAEYYLNHAHYPDLEAIRRGIDVSLECQDYDWEDPTMFNLTATQKIVSEITAYYPLHYRSLKLYHSGMFVNLVISATKRLLPPMVYQAIQTGLGRDYGPLPEVFSWPTPEAGRRRLIQKVQQALRMRYHNETYFSLD